MRDQASDNMKHAVDLAKDKGTSSWLSVFQLRSMVSSYISDYSEMPLP